MNEKNKKIMLSVLGILSLVIITIGVTYAIFTYTRLGSTENTVTTGTLKFLYTENTGVGNGISIENAFPVSDTVGKSYSTENYVFDFKVEGTNTGKDEIPYEVTLRKKSTSTLSESNVKVYLTDMTEDSDIEILEPTLYSNLTRTNIEVGDEIEKTIYNGTVLGNTANYLKEFRLRMWIDEASNQDEINGKTFTALVNVYSNVPLISEEEQNLRSNVEISKITIGEIEAKKVENQDYDYEVTLSNDTTSTTINVETENPYATVNVEKIDDLAYKELNVNRLSTIKTLNLIKGDNYFKITVTSEDGNAIYEYILKVNALICMNSTMTLSIGDAVTAIDGSKWHVLEDSAVGVDTVVLLSDYNLNSDGTYNTNCGMEINGEHTCSTMRFDPDNTNVYDDTDSNNVGYFLKTVYSKKVSEALPNTKNVTLPTVEQIEKVDDISVDVSLNTEYALFSDWLLTTSYYTKTSNTSYSYYVWAVYAKETARDIRTAQPINPSSIYGVRPVITTPKNNLLME